MRLCLPLGEDSRRCLGAGILDSAASPTPKREENEAQDQLRTCLRPHGGPKDADYTAAFPRSKKWCMVLNENERELGSTQHDPVPNVHCYTKSSYFLECASFRLSALYIFHEEYARFSLPEKQEPKLSFINCKANMRTQETQTWQKGVKKEHLPLPKRGAPATRSAEGDILVEDPRNMCPYLNTSNVHGHPL